jgi:hypothetical protein
VQRGSLPWKPLATVVLLSVAFGIALDAGRIIEAVLIAVVAIAPLLLLAISLYASRTADEDGDQQ